MTKPTAKTEALPDTDPDLLDPDFRLHDIEVEALDINIDLPEIELAELDLDTPPPKRPPAAPSATPSSTMPSGSGKSVRTTIRLPRHIVLEFKRLAMIDGRGYQTLMVRALREWLVGPRSSGSTV